MFPGYCISNTMKKVLICAAAGAALLSGVAQAQEFKAGDILVRARAVNLQSANSDSTGLGLSINNKTLPEVDFTYFFDKNLAAELILTVPQSQDVSSTALGGKIGILKHLPPTLTVQYHFDTTSAFKPYVGAGINYTRISDVNLPTGVDVDRNSWGLALQAGFDVPVAKDVYLNFDVKKVQIGTGVYSNGTKLGNLKVDPWLIGFGVGWKF